MALVALTQEEPEEVPDLLIEGDEVAEEVPELQIMSLHPVIIDGNEFLFLDDIAKTLGLREDEALSIIAISAGDQVTSTDKGKVKINFEDDNLTKALSYDVGSSCLEDVVAKALVQIKQDVHFYESIPDSAFEPHKPLFVGHGQDQGSINLAIEQVIASDDATEVCHVVIYF